VVNIGHYELLIHPFLLHYRSVRFSKSKKVKIKQ